MSHEQLQEVKTVLQRPKFSKYIHPHELDEFISLLSLKTIVPSNYGRINDCRDEKDNMILEATVYGNADFIITGDEDLLILDPYRWIKILSPVAFSKMAEELDTHYSTVRDWVKYYKQDDSNAFPGSGNLKPEDEELRRLRRELADLKEENEILKKLRPTLRKIRNNKVKIYP
ncbi:MAG: putative toxin-antitoxin system toxin component, PIN family [Clostridia bacterium]|nr:putative toxin-antitoxin system toxin component, PIN family [Clostridia bacterium]